MPIYLMGARAGKPDIFLEMDTMVSPTHPIPEKGFLLPKYTFADKGYGIHIDVGSTFTNAFDPERYNLTAPDTYQPGGQALPYHDITALEQSTESKRSAIEHSFTSRFGECTYLTMWFSDKWSLPSSTLAFHDWRSAYCDGDENAYQRGDAYVNYNEINSVRFTNWDITYRRHIRPKTMSQLRLPKDYNNVPNYMNDELFV